MNVLFLQTPLKPEEVAQLSREYPHYQIVAHSSDYLHPDKAGWKHVEIMYGSHLTEDELAQAEGLSWVHSPTFDLSQLCLSALKNRPHLLLTANPHENFMQVAEFVSAAVLMFSKPILAAALSKYSLTKLWGTDVLVPAWSLEKRVFLQVGLGLRGAAISQRAHNAGLHVIGVRNKPSFHPYCHQTIAFEDLPKYLPSADIVSLLLPPQEAYDDFLSWEELSLMKEDSILVSVGPHTLINADALYKYAPKLRGIVMDIPKSPELLEDSPLWEIPNLIMTPDISSLPPITSERKFGLFHYNLRQYACGNIEGMHNRVYPS